jgi:pantoate--beta-alanine ligase
MVRDLNFPLEIMVGPIVREPDGLAMSSRNAYLDLQQRKQALVLSKALEHVQKLFEQGERVAARLIEGGREVAAQQPAVRLDYFSVVDPESLEPVEQIRQTTLVAVAAHVGTTRLIDNLVLNGKNGALAETENPNREVRLTCRKDA